MNKDELYMSRAIDIATNGMGFVSPNPMVGAVIVHNDRIIGEGWHRHFGGPHAEVEAIAGVGNQDILKESTIYVSLEPCSHHGKTPPCSELLIRKKFKRVVIAVEDPNPVVSGRGLNQLKEAGLVVEHGILEREARELNKRFFHSFLHRRPYIILKWAQTMDGFIARKDYTSKWISSTASRHLVHKWRSEEDAILVGPDTAVYDNPALTVRGWHGRNPLRVVVDRHGRLPIDLNLFSDGNPTIYYSTLPDNGGRTCTHIQVNGEDFLSHVFRDLHHRGVLSVIVEGGASIHKHLISENLWDEARIFVSEKIFQEGIKAPPTPVGRIIRDRYFEDDLIFIQNRTTWPSN
jgi:diaminohydroxyphosphoribosylaminopyrimidine deaminase / 5-amino-6-(5-phosphoribosylamino)uracil reductase